MSTLPALREELALYAGPAAGNGAPTWSLLGPARNLFFRIDWLTFEILSRWYMDDPQDIAASIRRYTTLDIESSDLEQVLKFLSDNELLRRSTSQGTQWLHTLASKRRQTFAQNSCTIIYFSEYRCYARSAGLPVRSATSIPFTPRVFSGSRSWCYCWDWWKYRASGTDSWPRSSIPFRGKAF